MAVEKSKRWQVILALSDLVVSHRWIDCRGVNFARAPVPVADRGLGGLAPSQADVIAFLREENRLLKARLAGRSLRFDDGERRYLAVLGHRLGRRLWLKAEFS